jgi:hypothetical protein
MSRQRGVPLVRGAARAQKILKINQINQPTRCAEKASPCTVPGPAEKQNKVLLVIDGCNRPIENSP